MPSAYIEFVKKHFHKMPSNLSAKEKMSAIAKLYREQKSGAAPMKLKVQKPKKQAIAMDDDEEMGVEMPVMGSGEKMHKKMKKQTVLSPLVKGKKVKGGMVSGAGVSGGMVSGAGADKVMHESKHLDQLTKEMEQFLGL
jgi:hypothetical protein